MMKRIFGARFLTLLLALSLLPACAFAKTLRFNNKSGKKVFIAYIWLEQDSGRWRVQGWISTESGETVRREIECNNRYAFYYAYSADKKTYWRGKDGDGKSTKQEVVNEKMNFYRGQTPKGTNHREVWFRRIDSGDKGFWEINLTVN